MQSIGELFVKLGFDVDDTKLKSFNDSVQDVYGSILKIAGAAGLATGFYEMAKGAENNAVALRNLNTEMGVHYQYAQQFAALWKTVNPTSNIDTGLKITAQMAHYASQAFHGIGGSEYAQFGGTSSDFIDPKTGQFNGDTAVRNMLARLNSGRGLALSNAQGDQTRVTQFLQAITGSADIVNVLNASSVQKEKAETLSNLMAKEVDDTVKAAEGIAQLQTSWDNFINHAIASLAPKASGFLDAVSKDGILGGVDWIGANSYVPGAVDWIGKNAYIGHPIAALGNWEASGVAGLGAGVSHMAGSVLKRFSGNRAQSAAFWRSQGYSNPQIAAWLAQEQAESSYGTDRGINANGHFGAFQWSAARAAKILASTGIDVKTASHEDQLRAAHWEMQQMGLANSFRNINDAQDASHFLSKKFEMHEAFNSKHGDEGAYRANLAGDINNTVTINVQSNATDNAEVARLVHQRFINVTYPTQAKGGF